MKVTNVVLVTVAAVGALTIAGCNNNETGPLTTHEVTGTAANVGNGTARTYAVMQGDKAVSLGIELSDAALQNLPATDASWDLPLPAGVSLAPFDHATLNWNAQGHPPPGIYMVPHFDFHFYMVTPAVQATVQGGPYTATLASTYVPQDYAPDPVAVPDMGVHWTDTQAPEFHGQPFERTFIYGSYNGALTFIEPMVTLAYLQTHPNATMTVKQPQAFQKPGEYPQSYSVRYDAAAGMLRVSLDSLTVRQ